MEEQETPDEFPINKSLLELKIQERDEYLTQIDKETEEIEKKRLSISKAKSNIRSMTREIKKLKKIKRKVHEETISSGIPNLDLNLLNDEHRNFIIEKENIINSLADEIARLPVQDLSDDMEQTTQENAEYEIHYRKNKNELDLLHKELISIRSQIKTLDEKISYTNSSLKSVQQASVDAERALSGIIQRQEASIGDAKINLDKRVQSLREQRDSLENDIEEIKYQIKEIENDKNNYFEQSGQELKQVETIINWKSQKLAYEKEIAQVLEEIKETKKKTEKNEEKVVILQNRYKKVSQLASKWKDNQNIQSISINGQLSIDELIQQYSKLLNRTTIRSNQKSECLEVIINENAKLQSTIKKRHEELQRMISRYNYNKESIKQTIESSKIAAFDNEQATVDSINALRIKKASRKTPQKIPVFHTPKSLNRTPLKPINRIPLQTNRTPLKHVNQTPVRPT